jgi:hypothetical protein
MLIVLMFINVFKIENIVFLIMKSSELLMSCIHFTSMIFRRSYDCRKLMTFIMNRFFCVVSSLIRQSYNDFESMHNTKDTKRSRIADNVALKTASRSKLWTNAYNLIARTLRVTRLHLIDDQNNVNMLWINETYDIIDLWKQISIVCKKRIREDY